MLFLKRPLLGLPILIVLTLLAPAVAVAADGDVPPPDNTLLLSPLQFWAMVCGAAAPLVGYLLNYFGPQTDEKVKAVVQAVVAAGAGALYQLLATGDLAFDTQTFMVIGGAMFASIVAHIGYKAGGINTYLGGGRNRQDVVAETPR